MVLSKMSAKICSFNRKPNYLFGNISENLVFIRVLGDFGCLSFTFIRLLSNDETITS